MLSKTEMANRCQIWNDQSVRARQFNEHAVAMTLFIAAVVLFLTGCQHKPLMAHSTFKHIPSTGWLKTSPLSFNPQYDDSTVVYDITLAVRHDNSYPYRNLSMAVDVIAGDSTVTRKNLVVMLADEYGNWQGGGFGAMYQATANVALGVMPAQASKVVIWQVTSPGDALQGVADIGIIASPKSSRKLKTAD